MLADIETILENLKDTGPGRIGLWVASFVVIVVAMGTLAGMLVGKRKK